jgi:hypothetical protein
VLDYGRFEVSLDTSRDAPRDAKQDEEVPRVVTPGEETPEEDTAKSWARDLAWPIYLEELGGTGRQPSLLSGRLKKLSLLYAEQLSDEDDPEAAFRAILREVKASDHHMSNRDYQMPESLFRNEKRRERWTLKALENGRRPEGGGGDYISTDEEYEAMYGALPESGNRADVLAGLDGEGDDGE